MATKTTFASPRCVHVKASDQRQPRRETTCDLEIQRSKPFTNVHLQQDRQPEMANRIDTPSNVDFEDDDGDTIIVQTSQVPCRRLCSDGRSSRSQHDEGHPQKKQKLSRPFLHNPVDLRQRHINPKEQVERGEEHNPDNSRNQDLDFEPLHEDDADQETTALKIGEGGTKIFAQSASSLSNSEFFDAVVDRQGLDNLELKESLNSSLTEIENLKDENTAVGNVVRHLRRKILDLSLELSRLRKKNGASVCCNSVHHNKDAVSAEQQNMHTGMTGPTQQSAQQVKDLQTQLQHKTLESASLATREKQALRRQGILEQRLNASRLDLDVLDWHIQRAEEADKRNEILTRTLSIQENELAQVRHQVLTCQQETHSARRLLREKEEELSLIYQEKEEIQHTLNERRQELLVSQKGQTNTRALLEQAQEKLVAAQQEQQKTHALLSETQEQLRAYLKRGEGWATNVPEIDPSDQDLEGIRRRLGFSQKTVSDLKQKLDVWEKYNEKHYVSRKMLEHDFTMLERIARVSENSTEHIPSSIKELLL